MATGSGAQDGRFRPAPGQEHTPPKSLPVNQRVRLGGQAKSCPLSGAELTTASGALTEVGAFRPSFLLRAFPLPVFWCL